LNAAMISAMCGRYSIRQPGLFKKLVYFGPYYEDFSQVRIVPNFSIRPSDYVPIVRMRDDGRPALAEASWGLIPFWTKEKPKIAPINAVSETIASKPMFRESFKRRRCLMPADGFYEPKGPKTLKKRQPYFFQRPDHELFCFAALWDRWTPPDAEPVETCVLLTTAPNDLMRPIHDRMPVILASADFERWLDCDVSGDAVKDLLRPAPNDLLETWQVKDMEHDPETNRGIRTGVA
jgi:putative SOS response-associated peptidase YedK